ncbi:MAG TPA: hypothetical protein VGB70_05605 [Allosphingosinicella sp.]|jgi:hypothetical protein
MPPHPFFLATAAAILLAGCTAKVSHPTKTLAEQQVDIEGCTDAANDKYWMDPIAALLNAYDCLEAKGYKRDNAAVASQVQQAVKERRPAQRGAPPPVPCRVPCKSGNR